MLPAHKKRNRVHQEAHGALVKNHGRAADGVEIDSLEKYRQAIEGCNKLVKAMSKRKLKATRDEDKIAEGMRRIKVLRLKLETYRHDHRGAPRAAEVDQAVAEQRSLLGVEKVWGRERDELIDEMKEHAAKRRTLQAHRNTLFQNVVRAFEDTLADLYGDFEGLGMRKPDGAWAETDDLPIDVPHEGPDTPSWTPVRKPDGIPDPGRTPGLTPPENLVDGGSFDDEQYVEDPPMPQEREQIVQDGVAIVICSAGRPKELEKTLKLLQRQAADLHGRTFVQVDPNDLAINEYRAVSNQFRWVLEPTGYNIEKNTGNMIPYFSFIISYFIFLKI